MKPQRSEQFLKTGHAPGHIRECLLEALDHNEDWWRNLKMDFMRERHQRWWDSASDSERAYWLLGQLWHCTDTVPSLERVSVMDWIGTEEEYFSYATLARALKQDLDEQLEEQPVSVGS